MFPLKMNAFGAKQTQLAWGPHSTMDSINPLHPAARGVDSRYSKEFFMMQRFFA